MEICQLNRNQVFMCVAMTDMVQRKTLVLDLDETLIHSHHDGVLRQTVKPGTPPDFVLKVSKSPNNIISFIVLSVCVCVCVCVTVYLSCCLSFCLCGIIKVLFCPSAAKPVMFR